MGDAMNILTVDELDDLPVGAVVLDSGHRGLGLSERCAWQKSDDTELCDEYDGYPLSTAWGSIQWNEDRTSERLADEHGPITLLWDGSSLP